MRDMESLDPTDWSDLRALGHRMVDDMFDHLAGLRDGPVWRPMPAAARQALDGALPRGPRSADKVYEDFQRLVRPYATGNLHPRFMGWVHGGGTPVGMLAELLAGGLNANLGGRDHAPIEVERQVIRWSAEMLGFPGDASGSTTVVDGKLAIRAAIVNHRTNQTDIAILVEAVLEAGRARAEKKVPPVIHRGQVYREASRLGDAGTRGPLPATGAGTLAAALP